jgi:hypothetical protein
MRIFSHEPPYLTQELEDAEEPVELDFLFCRIAGHTWRYTLVTPKQMAIIHPEDPKAAGLCSSDDRVIFILDDSVQHNVIIHELAHAFKAASYTTSASLTADQIEEVFCDVFAYNWWKILRLANQMFYNLSLLIEVRRGARARDLHWEMPQADEGPEALIEELTELVESYNENDLSIFQITKAKKRPLRRKRGKARNRV